MPRAQVWRATLSAKTQKHKLHNVKALLSIALSVVSSACNFQRVASSNDGAKPPEPPPTQTTTSPNQRPQPASPIDKNWPDKYTFTSTSLAATVAGAELKAEYPRIRAAK